MKTIVSVPTINANDDSVVIVRWHVPDRGRVEAGAALVDVETTKAVVTIPAEQGGWVRWCGTEGAEIAVGGDLAWLFSGKAESDEADLGALAREATSEAKGPGNAAGTGAPTRLSPAAEHYAAEKGIDTAALARLRLGLVTRAQLEAGLGTTGRRERTPASKRAEIQILREGSHDSLRSSLTLYLDSAGVREAAVALGGSFLPVVLAELGPLLAEHPRFTAYYADGSTIFHDTVNIGVAVDLGQGLRVVVLKGADKLDAATIERHLSDLALDVMENRLGQADVEGATFTVTDLSGFDVLQFEPLLNARQAAILGIGGDSTLPGFPVSLTLAFDHRVLSGREVAAFLQRLRDRILARAAAPHRDVPCCDRCLIDLDSYYSKFGASAVMHQYVRPDGSTGLICHACLAAS
jgi:pyruvate/2-oxoglutarate dehydrogenase complex dihydrolipoamide acyltransferase (E2) component